MYKNVQIFSSTFVFHLMIVILDFPGTDNSKFPRSLVYIMSLPHEEMIARAQELVVDSALSENSCVLGGKYNNTG